MGQRLDAFIKFFFYGNYFIGLCVVALSVEATLQQQFPLNPLYYFITVFCLSVVYYTHAYITNSSGYSSNERNNWYARHKIFVKFSQALLTALAAALTILFLFSNIDAIKKISFLQFFLFAIFPVTALLYYGVNERLNIRNLGALKPFIIGFSWAGVVTWYPVLFYTLQKQIDYEITFVGCLLFIKNFMFISVLCIMFDIKDYAHDASRNLKTIIVKAGLRRTIFFVIIPLGLIGLATFLLYAISRDFHPGKIALNVIPFILMIVAGYSLHERRKLLFYLIYIDGLMFVKGVCGTLAMLYF